MEWIRILLIAILLISGSITGSLGIFAFNRGNQTGTKEFIGFILAMLIYFIGYAFEVASNTLPQMLLCMKIEYLGLCFIPFFWLMLACRYVGLEGWPKVLLRDIFLGFAVLFLILHSTNDIHHLFYNNIRFCETPFPTFSDTSGPGYLMYLCYFGLSILFADFLLVKQWQRSMDIYRGQIFMLLFASLIPVAANLIYQLDFFPREFEPSPLAFLLSGVLIAKGLFKYKLFDLVPIARDRIFESIHDGVVVLDLDNRIVDFNPAAKSILVELNPTVIGRDGLDLLKNHHQLIFQITGNLVQIEFCIGDGVDKRFISSRLSSIVSPGTRREPERTAGIMLILSDVTLEKQSQAQLIRSEKMAVLGQLVANVSHEINTPLAAIKATAENMNASFCQLQNQLGPLFERMGIPLDPVIAEIIEKVQNATPKTTREERESLQKLLPQLQERNLEHAEKTIRYLAKLGLADEFDRLTPVFHSPKTAFLEYILGMAITRRDIQNILQAVEKTSKISYALKSYSHTATENHPQLTDVQAGIETVLQIYENILKKGVGVQVHAETVPQIVAYPDELQQIWMNLIYNAIQAMKGSGDLLIEIRQNAGEVVVGITDNGPGISEDILPKIFNPFFTTKQIGEGSGLGLAVCKQIVERHQGRITVRSKPGQTSFLVYLPVKSQIQQMTG